MLQILPVFLNRNAGFFMLMINFKSYFSSQLNHLKPDLQPIDHSFSIISIIQLTVNFTIYVVIFKYLLNIDLFDTTRL
jgi:hypothetical protein